MNPEQETDHHADALDFRRTVAQALLSGDYLQHDPEDPEPPLRDEDNRYSVTGVAAALTPEQLWVLTKDGWQSAWMDPFTYACPGRRSIPGEVTDLTPIEEATLKDLNEMSGTHCPENTACRLGLPDHDCTLTLDTRLIPAKDRRRLGIPAHGPRSWPIDSLTFQAAAEVLTTHPGALPLDTSH